MVDMNLLKVEEHTAMTAAMVSYVESTAPRAGASTAESRRARVMMREMHCLIQSLVSERKQWRFYNISHVQLGCDYATVTLENVQLRQQLDELRTAYAKLEVEPTESLLASCVEEPVSEGTPDVTLSLDDLDSIVAELDKENSVSPTTAFEKSLDEEATGKRQCLRSNTASPIGLAFRSLSDSFVGEH